MPSSRVWSPPPGHYCPRMWRAGSEPITLDFPVEFQRAGTALKLIARDLEGVLEVVDPVSCSDSFGPRIHQLLLAACIEVEAAWVGVLRANTYSNRARFTTVDFVKLLAPMRLSDYRIQLEGYHDYPEIRPFMGWIEARPTESLRWYSAYNKIKHDREKNATQGSLKHLIDACAAVLVMATAQFGQEPFLPGGKFEQKTLYLHGVCCYAAGEPYIGPSDEGFWKQRVYEF